MRRKQASGGNGATMAEYAADWYPDPMGRGDLRYWDGQAWTEHVSRGGVQTTDPVLPDASAPPHYRWVNWLGWKCIAHDKFDCKECPQSFGPGPSRAPLKGEPHVASGELPCPHCGSTRYTGYTSVGDVADLVLTPWAAGSHVRCLNCGKTFRK
jgi:hypothetical protein